jgi:hypothetical protein
VFVKTSEDCVLAAGADVPVADVTGAAALRHWHRDSAGAGGKGPRYYRWAWAPIDPQAPDIDGC